MTKKIMLMALGSTLLFSIEAFANPSRGWASLSEGEQRFIDKKHSPHQGRKNNIQSAMASVIPPRSFDLSAATKVLDQEALGSCVINAFTVSVHALQSLESFKNQGGNIRHLPTKAIKKSYPRESHSYGTQKVSFTSNSPDIRAIKKSIPLYSRLFGYRDVLGMQGEIDDEGTNALAAYLSFQRGWAYENTYPYDINHFTKTPTIQAYKEAALNAQKTHVNVSSINIDKSAPDIIEQTVASGKFVMISMNVYESFRSLEVEETGRVPLPQSGEKIVGVHEVTIVGYDRDEGTFLINNSWGKSWGLNGFGKIPYAMVSNPEHTNDLMRIKLSKNIM